MKILFVSSGNSDKGISPIIVAQGNSLVNKDVEIDYYTIKGRGIIGYLRNVIPLRKDYIKGGYDLCHAHFSLTAFVASLAGIKPLVVSLMGWNVEQPILRWFIRFFCKYSWSSCIVKSEKMKSALQLDNLEVIPNGIDLDLFKPLEKKECVVKLGWDSMKVNILFAGNPKRPIKNYPLAEGAINRLNRPDIVVHTLGGVEHSKMPLLYNGSDIVLLTSIAEGSPNVIKEAMACNCIIVSTDVGDVAERFDDAAGCFLTNQTVEDIVEKLQLALEYKGDVDTRSKVLDLDSKIIAQKIVDIYTNALMKTERH